MLHDQFFKHSLLNITDYQQNVYFLNVQLTYDITLKKEYTCNVGEVTVIL